MSTPPHGAPLSFHRLSTLLWVVSATKNSNLALIIKTRVPSFHLSLMEGTQPPHSLAKYNHQRDQADYASSF